MNRVNTKVGSIWMHFKLIGQLITYSSTVYSSSLHQDSMTFKVLDDSHLSGGFGIQSAADRLFLFPPLKQIGVQIDSIKHFIHYFFTLHVHCKPHITIYLLMPKLCISIG